MGVTALVAIGTAVSAIGAVVGGVAQYQAARNSAAIDEMNAQIADDNAKRAIQRSQVEQQQQDVQTRAMYGAQLAAQAGSGVSVERGSPVKTRIAARELGRLDALNVRQAGELEAYGYKTQKVNYEAAAKNKRQAATFSLLGGFLNAGSVITNARATSPRNYDYTYAPVPVPRPASIAY